MKKRKEKTFYKYQCTLTQEEFITTRQAPHPDELMSVKAYYDLHSQEDDRPAVMKARLGLNEANEATDALAAEAKAEEKASK